MTFLAPIPLPVKAPSLDSWQAFVSSHVDTFFARNCANAQFDGVVLMMLPLPDALPLIAIEDEYDNEDTLLQQVAAAADALGDLTSFVPANDAGHVVVAWPYVCASRDHRAFIHELLRSVAETTGAVACAVVNECWLRTDLSAPSGTGEENIMALVEREGHDTIACVARIEGGPRSRTLAPWRDLPGTATGPLAGSILPRVPRGFTPKINVSTVGEA
jgi:hypothetical protein